MIRHRARAKGARLRSDVVVALAAMVGWMGVGNPDAPVADAAMFEDVAEVRSLLQNGADVNAAHGDGMTALHWAARHGHVELTEMLVYAGGHLDATTRLGPFTPAMIAAEGGHGDVVEVLLEAGADPEVATSTGVTALHLAARSGSEEAVRALLDRGAAVDAMENAWNQTPLIWAADAGRSAVVELLILAGADVTTQSKVVIPRDLEAEDAVLSREYAARMAEVRAARLAEATGGADTTPPAEETEDEDASSEEGDEEEESPEEAGEEEAAEEETEEEPTEETEEEASEEPEEEASEETEEEAATEEEDDEEEDEVDRDAAGLPTAPPQPSDEERPLSYGELVGGLGGLSPLHHAVREGHRDAAMALLDAGADINQVTGGDHSSPMVLATINGHFDLAIELMERGADVNLASDAGVTPLFGAINVHWAPKALYPQPKAHEQQQHSYLQFMEKVLEAGADVNARVSKHIWFMSYNFDLLGVNVDGATPFWRAAYAADVEAMKLLVAWGADPNIPTRKQPQRRFRRGGDDTEDKSGLDPVPVGGPAIYPIHAASGVGFGQGYAANAHRSVPDGWVPAVKYLVEELGADVNARDHDGFSAVHHAASRGDNELIHYLVEMGADVTLVSRRGQTTADMANGPVQRVQPYPETVALLESLGSENNNNCRSC
jgi:ankyrin repeat protein